MEKDEGDGVSPGGTETGAEKRDAAAVGSLDGFHFFASDFGGEDVYASGKIHFQERLTLIFHREFNFGDRFAFGGDERGDDGALGDGGENAGVGEASPVERECWGFVRLPVIAERGFERIAGKRAEIGIDFLDVEALEAAGFVGGEFESALAFDEDFAGFALRVFEGENGSGGFGVGERALHGDEEFVGGMAAAGYVEKENAVLDFAGFERSAVDGSDFEAVGDGDGELVCVALDDGDVGERGDLQIGFADGDEGFYVGEKTDFARRYGGDDFAGGPPDSRDLAGDERGFDFGVAFDGSAMGDDAVVELDVGAIAGNGEREADAAGGWNWKKERGAAGFDREGKAGVEVDGEFGFTGKDGDVGAVVEEKRERTRAVAGVEDGHASGERNFRGVGAESFAFELDGAKDVVVGDAEFQIGALEDVGKRRKFGTFSGAIGEGEEAVVLVERESDVAGWGKRRFKAPLSERGNREREQ